MRTSLTSLATVCLALLVGCDAPAPDPTPSAQSAAPESAPVAPEPPPINNEQVARLSGVLTQSAAAGQLRHLAGRRALIGHVTLDGVPTGRGIAMLGGLDSEAIDFDALNEGRFLLDVPDDYSGGLLQVTVVEPFVGELFTELDADQVHVGFELTDDDLDTIEVEFVRPPDVSQLPMGMFLTGGPDVLDERMLPVVREAHCVEGNSRCIIHEMRVSTHTARFRALRQRPVFVWARTHHGHLRYRPSPPPGVSCAFQLDDGPRQTVDDDDIPFIELPGDRPPRTKLTIEMCPNLHPSAPRQDTAP